MLPIFPQFAPLTINDKDMYNHLVAGYPSVSDICFTTLQIWWNLDNKLAFSLLNDNLVIRYELSFDSTNSGLGLVGINAPDESVQTIFDYLRSTNKSAKLLHVPDFVTEKMKHPERLKLEEELDYNEYILDSLALASLEGSGLGPIRRKVNRFLRDANDRQLEVKTLDLSSQENKDILFNAMVSWETVHSTRNDPEHTENQSIQKTLIYSSVFETQNLVFYVDGELWAFALYHLSRDKKYYILNHLKVDYRLPYIFDYVTNLVAQRAVSEGVPFINMEMDLGIEGLRQHKMGLKPVRFFRKYTVMPADL